MLIPISRAEFEQTYTLRQDRTHPQLTVRKNHQEVITVTVCGNCIFLVHTLVHTFTTYRAEHYVAVHPSRILDDIKLLITERLGDIADTYDR